MNDPTKNDVLTKLALIDFGDGITADDIATGVTITKNGDSFTIQVLLNIPPDMTQEEIYSLKAKAEMALGNVAPNAQIVVALSSHNPAPSPKFKPEPKPKAEVKPKAKKAKKTILVSSGKGGVGKSTIATNLAYFLASQSMKVGILDGDIKTPSLHQLTGIRKPMEFNEDGIVKPHMHNNVALASLGFALKDGQAAIMRAPMVDKMVHNLIHTVEWGDLDLLLVDTPPGTGDTLLSLHNHMHIDGAIVVSTPQEMSLVDTRRGIEMFSKMNVPVLGMVENMSAPSTGPNFFGEGGVEKEAKDQDLEFLGRIPLDQKFMQTSDQGRPVSLHEPHSPHADHFKNIGLALMAKLVF